LGDHGLVLAAQSGARVRARRFVQGEMVSRDGVALSREPRRFVELVSMGTRVEHELGTYRIEQLAALGDRELVPAGKPAFTLPASEVRRLLSWASGSTEATGDGAILLVGDPAETGRLRVGLSRLPLRLEQVEDPRRALALIEVDPPDLLIVGPGLHGGARELVEAVRHSLGLSELSILVLGGDESDALALGANAHLPDLSDPRALVDRVAELVELV
jgi:hypothetical protein